MSQELQDTITALATPPGIGAIGVIRVSGPETIKIVNELFAGKDLTKASTHRLFFGTIRSNEEDH